MGDAELYSSTYREAYQRIRTTVDIVQQEHSPTHNKEEQPRESIP